MSPSKIWQIKAKIKSRIASKRREEIFKRVLKNRGIKTALERKRFLDPRSPQDFFLKELGINSKEVNKAIVLLKQAIKEKKAVVVYGDYDSDGICATAIIWETLYSLGARILPFIPDREKHGYGLSVKAIKEIIKNPQYKIKNSGIIITVDNGIVANKAVEFAKKNGFKVIITDHHQKKKKLPPADAIIHTTALSGSGVAFFFAREILKKLDKKKNFILQELLELAAIGTVADIMPLQGANRSLVKFGFGVLQKTSRIGLQALYKAAGIKAARLGIYEVSYIISPRINAMGRISESLDALRLLCTKDKEKAKRLAQVLDRTNRLRRNLMEETFLHAQEKAKKQLKKKLLFISEKNYNQGIIGLVAGRLSEAFYRPAMVTTVVDGFAKGSARSIKGFNIIKALRSFEKDFLDLGGHKMAAGFSIELGNLQKLKNKIQKLAEKEISDKDLKPSLEVDCEIKLKDITLNLFFLLEKLAPFGLGNSRPTFATHNLKITSLRRVGREEQHLKLTLGDPETEAIAFGFGAKLPDLKKGDKIDVVYSLDLNHWNRQEKLQLKIKDIKVGSRI